MTREGSDGGAKTGTAASEKPPYRAGVMFWFTRKTFSGS